jgi:hypothetical protein
MLGSKPPFKDYDTTLYKVLKVSRAHVREEATIKRNPDPKIILAVYIRLPDRIDGLQVFKAWGAGPDLATNEEVCFGESVVVCALDHDSVHVLALLVSHKVIFEALHELILSLSLCIHSIFVLLHSHL